VLQGAPAASLERPGKLLGLAQQYLEGSPSPAMPALAEAYLAQPMSQLAAALASLGPLSEWDAAAKSALDALLQLSALMLRRCQVCTALIRIWNWCIEGLCPRLHMTATVLGVKAWP
jgi:hypothetical protein